LNEKLARLDTRTIWLFFIISIATNQVILAMDSDHLLFALDRSTYKINEIVTFSVKNKSDATIWYQNHNCHFYPELQKFERQEWKSIDFTPNRQRHCDKKVKRINAGEVIKYERDYSALATQSTLPKFGPGRYRYHFIYYIKDISNHPEESPPSDIKVYSSFSEEFVMQSE